MRKAKVLICAALSAAALGGSLIAASPRPAPVAEACVVYAQSGGACVLPGRSPGVDSGQWTVDSEPRVLVIRERHIAGILPEIEAEAEIEAEEAEAARRYLGQYKITGYDVCVHCCGKTDGITASGTQATVGRTCAAPPDIPFGTRLWIEGVGERIVEDRGCLGTSKIDVLCEDHPACYAITTEGKVDVWIVEGQR